MGAKYYLISRPYENKTYLAVGSMKVVMLNVSLFNAGDDAYETTLHVRLPAGLYFIKILDLVSTAHHNSIMLLRFY
jgi:hypothetical protein